jgi:S1-C subfamily serine protease
MRGWSIVGVVVGLAMIAVGAGPPMPSPSTSATRTVPTSPTSRRPVPADDRTFRPTVVVRNGVKQGSGTIIASIDGETLLLTAAHVVVDGKGPLTVELHRYNLGLERLSRIAGGWPRSLPAEVVADDRSADLAVLRIKGMKRLPYVARLTSGVEEPARGTVVTSVGIDLGEHLSSWMAYVDGVSLFKLDTKKEERPFLITTRSPEHGRSGGGLFLKGGEMVGVCIGRVEEPKQERVGIFASGASIRRLLRDHDLDETIARSEALASQATTGRHADPSSSTPTPTPAPAGALPITPTQARPGGRAEGP